MPPTSPKRPLEHRPAADGWPALEIHRSTRRRRTSSAQLQEGRIVVRLPAGMPPAEEERHIDTLVRRVLGRDRAERAGGDAALQRRADALADRYLDGVRASSVRWSARMRQRHGSCRPSDGSIRISEELAVHPDYVLDAVLVHELAHLHHRDHSPAFHALVARYPQAERATGYLAGFAAGWTVGAAQSSASPGSEPAAPVPGWSSPGSEPAPPVPGWSSPG